MTTWLTMKLEIHFNWYFDKEKRLGIETWHQHDCYVREFSTEILCRKYEKQTLDRPFFIFEQPAVKCEPKFNDFW